MEPSYYFEEQYSLVCDARKILLTYCSNISERDLLTENPDFGHASIRNLLVHVANCYQAWLNRALKRPFEKTEFTEIESIEGIEHLFEKVNALMAEFIGFIRKEDPEVLELFQYEIVRMASPMALFSHVITHEFHHKGQILSMSRQMGYIPVDTDIIR